MRPQPLVFLVTFLAGAIDAVTGAMLIAAPITTLHLFGATLPGGEAATILVRFVGVFVAGVGLSYLWALASSVAEARAGRLPGVWGATAVVRGCVALFCFTATASHQLEANWLIVGGTDAILAAGQAWALRSGWLET
jgi:hypothetical protein